MIVIVVTISTSMKSRDYHFLLVVGIIKIEFLSRFDHYNTIVLSTFTSSLGLIYYSLQVGTLKQYLSPCLLVDNCFGLRLKGP